MDYTTPALAGAYSAGGLYVARWLKGSSQDISLVVLGTAAAIGAGSAFVAPQITNKLVCPHSPGAPLVESAASAAVSWAVIWAMNDMESANMFVPVQFGSHLLALYIAPYVRAYSVGRKIASDSEAYLEKAVPTTLDLSTTAEQTIKPKEVMLQL